MKDWQKTSIALHLEHLTDRINIWENNLATGSIDPTYAVGCSANILEATAERNGIIYTLSVFGYEPHFSENNIHSTKCEIVEIKKD